MLKQSPSRNQRSKGFKVKHVLQIFLLLAICVWLLYQMKRSHDKKKAYDEESSAEVLGKLQSGGELIRLGRRDLRPLVKGASFRVEKHDGKEEEEVEEGMGGADDEIDVRDRERTEEEESEGAEDLNDEEDRERDELGSEEDKEIDLEDANLLEDQDEVEEGKSDLQEAKEKRYKDRDDVDSDVALDIQGISRSLRKVEVEKFENANDDAEKGTETYYHENSETKALGVSMAKSLDSENATSTYSDNTMSSNMKNGSMLLLVKDATNLNGTKLNPATSGRDSYLQTAIEERSEDSRAESVGTYSDSTLSTIDNSEADGSFLSGTLPLDAVAVAGKSASMITTNKNAVSSGESKTNGGLYVGEESSVASKTKGNSDAVDDEEEEEEKSIDSSDLSLSEEVQEENSIMDGL